MYAYLHPSEKVLAPRKTSHEEKRVNPLIDLPRLLFDQIEYLRYDRIKDFPTQEISWDGKLAVYKANGRIMRIFNIKSRKVKHVIYVKKKHH